MTAADLVIEELADREAELREANRQLVDLVADLAWENAVLRTVWEKEAVSRIYGDGRIALLTRRLYPKRS